MAKIRKIQGRRGEPALPYQEPHRVGAANGKLLEETIGREVRRYREKLGLTISELAKAAAMSAGMLSKIENGATSPSAPDAISPITNNAASPTPPFKKRCLNVR